MLLFMFEIYISIFSSAHDIIHTLRNGANPPTVSVCMIGCRRFVCKQFYAAALFMQHTRKFSMVRHVGMHGCRFRVWESFQASFSICHGAQVDQWWRVIMYLLHMASQSFIRTEDRFAAWMKARNCNGTVSVFDMLCQ